MNEQFLSRNQFEIADLITKFKELVTIYPHVVLYLDKDSWEVFDTQFCKPLFRRSFKQVNTLRDELSKLRLNIINVGCIKYRRDGKPDKLQSWALRNLSLLYEEPEIKLLMYGKIN